ncbi:MAG: diversity-generating retroelement protein Avd [Bacilli bacterium]
MEELIILEKAYEMIEYGYLVLQQFPKSEKFALAVDIKRCMHTILERIIEAQKKYYKKTTLQELDVEVMKLRAFVKLGYKLGFIPLKKYEIWSAKNVEIGKMIGGWIKSTQR